MWTFSKSREVLVLRPGSDSSDHPRRRGHGSAAWHGESGGSVVQECRWDEMFRYLVNVTSTSGISKHATVAGVAEQRKAASYSKMWKLESERAKLIFFGIQLSGCLGPEATHLQADGRSRREGPEGDMKVCPVNRAIRIDITKRGLFGGFGLGVEEVRGLG
jgi:hypothetical protein